jgi:hypothetical protein
MLPPVDRCEIREALQLDAALGGAGYNRSGERVFAVSFDGGGGGEQFLLGDGSRGNDIRQARFAFCQRPGLIHDHHLHLFHPLHRRSLFTPSPRGRGGAALFDVGYLLRRFYSNVPRRTTTAMPK